MKKGTKNREKEEEERGKAGIALALHSHAYINPQYTKFYHCFCFLQNRRYISIIDLVHQPYYDYTVISMASVYPSYINYKLLSLLYSADNMPTNTPTSLSLKRMIA